MSLYRRGTTYWVSFRDSTGRRVRRSLGTSDKAQAQELSDKLRADLWRVNKLGEKPRRTWQEAIVRYVRETSHKASHSGDVLNLRWLDKHLRHYMLEDITRDVVDKVTEARIADGVSNATVNRTMAVLRAVLRRAVKQWEWLTRYPAVRMLPEPKGRVRWLTYEEEARLMEQLPEHLREVVSFALATGLRRRNITHLKWAEVDLERRVAWVHADEAKARKAIGVPLNADAVLVLRRQQGKHPVFVFSYKGQAPVAGVNGTAWKKALKRSGLVGVCFHTLRHTWASRHAQAGTPFGALQELGGWSSSAIVRRYAHLAPEHLAKYAEAIARPKLVASAEVTKLAQSAPSGKRKVG